MDAVRHTLQQIDTHCSTAFDDGSTATIAIVLANTIHVLNIGDSQAIMCWQNGTAQALNTLHKPNDAQEQQRIESIKGGRVTRRMGDVARVQGILATSRALGDSYLKPYVSAEPDLFHYDRHADQKYLIVASDGLYDTLAHNAICEQLLGMKNVSLRDMAQGITNEALAQGSTDNITVILVQL